MNNQNSFEEKLEKLIVQLPEYEPDKSVWRNIEAQMDFEDEVEKEKIGLPEKNPKKDIWANISKQLVCDETNKKNKKTRKIVFYSLSAAAAVIIGFGLINILNGNSKIEITYSQEELTLYEHKDVTGANEIDPMELLDENCQTIPEICNSPEFIEKKELLFELNVERKNITDVIDNYGESPELIKSLIKIENLKSSIIKDLLKKINS